ncbi:MAG: hypothetical protein AB1696_05960 [Planctomycetota bacterium]
MTTPHGKLTLGWASRDITPSRPVLLLGQFHSRISERVNDPLSVTALAVEAKNENGACEQAVIVSADHAVIPGFILAQVRERVRAAAPDLDVKKVFLSATHTHTAPTVTDGIYPPAAPEVMTPAECAEQFVQSASGAIVEAWTNRRPAGVSWGFGHAVVGHNRRMTYLDGASKMYGNTNDVNFSHIEGYEDHGVDLLFTWDEKDRLTGVVVNLACPSQVTEGAKCVSADFWHEARVEIRRRLGADLFILPQCAAAGDQSPHLLLDKKAEEFMRKGTGVTEREEIALRIADAVEDVLPVAQKQIRTHAPFRHVARTIDLPVRKVTDEEVAFARSECDRLRKADPDVKNSPTFVHLRRHNRVIQRYEEQKTKPFYPMELHVIRLGDVAMATNPFELFLDFGVRIKARSQAVQTFLVQLACDWTGYLPTARAVAARSYGAEVASNQVGPEGGQALVEETLKSIDELWINETR